jgi:hypothetical protein
MAHPGDRNLGTKPGNGGAAVFVNAKLSFDDAERLAASFRPSWELDDAPFTGAGTLSDADVGALQGGGTSAQVRASLRANGSTAGHEPENSVVIDRAITAADIPPKLAAVPAAPAHGMTMRLGAQAPAVAAQARPEPAALAAAPSPWAGPGGTIILPPGAAPKIPQPQAAPVAARPAPPSPAAQARAQRPAVARPVDIDEPVVPKKSKGILIGAAAVLVIAAGIGIAVAMGGNKEAQKAAPMPTKTEEKTSAIPPPPPPDEVTTGTAAAATTTAAPTPTTTATTASTGASNAGTSTPSTAAAGGGPPTPQTTVAAATTTTTTTNSNLSKSTFSSNPYGPAPTPAQKPQGKPGGGKGNIVRDAPF